MSILSDLLDKTDLDEKIVGFIKDADRLSKTAFLLKHYKILIGSIAIVSFIAGAAIGSQ